VPSIGGFLLDYGLYGVVVAIAVVGWWWAFEQVKEVRAATKLLGDEREKRNQDGHAAARELYDQKVLNVEVKAAIEFRDYRIAELQRDLERCERERSPLPEAAS
jgi:hypothetical protein